MKKSVYDLFLSDEVIAEVDRIAKRRGSNRSATVNRILSEYLNLDTPERRIEGLYSELESYFTREQQQLVPMILPGRRSLHLREHRVESLRYDVELLEGENGKILAEMVLEFHPRYREKAASFFTFLRLFEERYASNDDRGYAMVENKIIRTFRLDARQDLEKVAIYVCMINNLLKGYLTGEYTDRCLELEYLCYIKEGVHQI